MPKIYILGLKGQEVWSSYLWAFIAVYRRQNRSICALRFILSWEMIET